MVIVAINDKAKVVREAKLPSSGQALDDFFGTLQNPVQAVVERASFWYWLSDWYRDNNIPLTLAHSKMAGAISYAKVKTDKVDAKTLAELLRVGLIPEAYQAKPARRALRELTRGRLRMTGWRSKLQSTLWGGAAKYNGQISGTQWRYPDKLEEWLHPQLPPAGNLQAQLMLGQIRQLQTDIRRIEQEIETQAEFNATAERFQAVPGLGKVGPRRF